MQQNIPTTQPDKHTDKEITGGNADLFLLFLLVSVDNCYTILLYNKVAMSKPGHTHTHTHKTVRRTAREEGDKDGWEGGRGGGCR